MANIMRNRNMPYILGLVACLVVVLVVTAVSGSGVRSLERELSAQQTEMADLGNQISVKRTQVNQGTQGVATQVTGIDLARVQKDNEIAKELISKVTTWSSQAEYDALREEMMLTYHLEARDRFMSTFLPATTDIDALQLNCHYSNMKAMVSNIAGAKYSYFTVVTASGSRSGATASFNFIMTYDIDGNGNLSNLSAYTLA